MQRFTYAAVQALGVIGSLNENCCQPSQSTINPRQICTAPTRPIMTGMATATIRSHAMTIVFDALFGGCVPRRLQ
jgi:hypothetical protein